jgi:hypothetical protein
VSIIVVSNIGTLVQVSTPIITNTKFVYKMFNKYYMSNNSFNIGKNWNKDDLVKKEVRGIYGIVDFREDVTNEHCNWKRNYRKRAVYFTEFS